jgi:hypothetical protein
MVSYYLLYREKRGAAIIMQKKPKEVKTPTKATSSVTIDF